MSNSLATKLVEVGGHTNNRSNASLLRRFGILTTCRRQARRTRDLKGCEWLETRTVLSASAPMTDALPASPIDDGPNEPPASVCSNTPGAKDSNSSCWIRVAQLHTDEGDVDRPVIVGHVPNGDSAPPSARDVVFGLYATFGSDMPGSCTCAPPVDWTELISFQDEPQESGEKGGTEDINIGVGELQECTISKSMDRTSSVLAQFAINGNSLGTAQIDFVEVGGTGEDGNLNYVQYELNRCFVKSWSTSGDADDRPTEEVAFYYNRIAFE